MGLTASCSVLFIWFRGQWGIGSQVRDGAIAQFIHSSVSYTVVLNFGAVTACQHSESAVINHHTFDQNAANLYCFL